MFFFYQNWIVIPRVLAAVGNQYQQITTRKDSAENTKIRYKDIAYCTRHKTR